MSDYMRDALDRVIINLLCVSFYICFCFSVQVCLLGLQEEAEAAAGVFSDPAASLRGSASVASCPTALRFHLIADPITSIDFSIASCPLLFPGPEFGLHIKDLLILTLNDPSKILTHWELSKLFILSLTNLTYFMINKRF